MTNEPGDGPIVFLVPDIHDLQTGGNVFNRRMVAGPRPETAVRVQTWAPDARPAPELNRPDASLIVVDSLLARHPDALRAVRERTAATPLILLVHYLRCIDPHAPDSDGVADERATLDVVDGAVTTSRYVKQALVGEGPPAERVRVVRPGLGERLLVVTTAPVRVDGEVVGFATAHRWGPPPIYAESSEVFIDELYVRPDDRRQGLGSQLVQAVRDWTGRIGAQRLRLNVLAANEEARAFWAAQEARPLTVTLAVEHEGAEDATDDEGSKKIGF